MRSTEPVQVLSMIPTLVGMMAALEVATPSTVFVGAAALTPPPPAPIVSATAPAIDITVFAILLVIIAPNLPTKPVAGRREQDAFMPCLLVP